MKLSIITINLNNAPGLRKTIESVVSQTFSDFEYIIIDGGSTDGSVEVIREYSDKITFWISERDKGIYNAMNKGIEKANGEYCLFLNSGDWLADKKVVEIIFKYDTIADIIYGNIMIIKDDGMSYRGGPCTDNITAYQLITSNIPHQSSFIRKTLFEKFGRYDENYNLVSDLKFFYKTIIENNVIAKYMDIVVSNYNLNGISSRNQNLVEKERRQVLSEFLPKKVIVDYEYAYRELNEFSEKKSQLERDLHLVAMNKTIRSHWLSKKLQTGLHYVVKKYEKVIERAK